LANHKIVVASVPPNAQPAVTTALAQLLGIQEEVAKQITGSAPIVVLGGLVPEQATAILEAFAPVKRAGAQIVISAAESASMPHITWPTPPLIARRGLDTYMPGYVAPPPAPVSTPAPAPPAAATRPGSGVGAAQVATGSAQIPCPHCGKAIIVAFAQPPSAAAGAGMTGSGIRQVPVPLGLADAGPVAAPLPEVPNVPPARPASQPVQSSATRAGPMDLEEFERGVGGGKPPSASADALLRQLDASLPAKDPGLRALEGSPPKAPDDKKGRGSGKHGPTSARRFRDRRH
jgi:hypothetical protein